MTASDAIGFERLEALLAGDVPRTTDEARRAAVLAQLRETTLSAPEALRSRVLATAPSRRRSFGRKPSRRLVFAVIPAAFALAVTAAIVHGLTNSPAPQPVSAKQSSTLPQPAPKRAAVPPTFSAAGDGASPSHTRAPNSRRSRRPAVRAASSTRMRRFRCACPTLSISRARRARQRESRRRSAALRSRSTTRRRSGGSGTASIELRVPAQNVQRALERLAGLGTLVSQNVSVTGSAARGSGSVGADRTAAEDESRRCTRRSPIPRSRTRSVCCSRSKLAESKRALAQRLNARAGTVAAGTTARISLVLGTQKTSIVPACPPPRPDGPDAALRGRLPRPSRRRSRSTL